MSQQLPGHYGHIPRRGKMALHRQTGTVYKSSVIHAQLLGFFIHTSYERPLISRKMLSHCYAGVVSRRYNYRFYKLAGRILPMSVCEYMRTAYISGVFADRYFIVQLKRALLHLVEYKTKAHYFSNAGNRKGLIYVFFIEYCSRFIFHKQARSGVYIKFGLGFSYRN